MFLEGKGVVEWGLAEALAFGSLILCGVSVRLVGQDAIRGTFSHRHLGLDHYPLDLSENQQIQYFPLNSLAQAGASTLTDMRPALFEVFNTTLSEAGVMGFEYGYSVTAFNRLVLWEGQFGDFANGAQVIIDQFLSSSESKWNELCGLVLLLPHGCEGQGPEHTSARLERFLQLCAEGNMTVVYPTTSSQYFHLLRRQAFAEVKRPLVVMTPKSLLRSSEAMSELSAFKAGTFEPIIVKHIGENPQTLFLCTGKIYFDIYRAIEDLGTGSATIVRIEQLYPFPELELQELFGNLKPKRICWVQEEHQNQGAWWFVERKMRELGVMPEVLQLHYIGRSESASTATGSPKYHYKEHKAILDSVVAEINVSC
jgi:2-oxoglutarate dehydrogenase E1 component